MLEKKSQQSSTTRGHRGRCHGRNESLRGRVSLRETGRSLLASLSRLRVDRTVKTCWRASNNNENTHTNTIERDFLTDDQRIGISAIYLHRTPGRSEDASGVDLVGPWQALFLLGWGGAFAARGKWQTGVRWEGRRREWRVQPSTLHNSLHICMECRNILMEEESANGSTNRTYGCFGFWRLSWFGEKQVRVSIAETSRFKQHR